MRDPAANLVKMANQIGEFFGPQHLNDPAAAAKAVAGHLKSFWAPSMRADLFDAYEAGHAEELMPVVAAALRDHHSELLVGGGRVKGVPNEAFPEGGGDAG